MNEYPGRHDGNKATMTANPNRWEPRGAMWVAADTNLTSGESLIRQLLYGMRCYIEEFGKEPEILWLPDVFSYSGALPQVLRGCGIRYFLTRKNPWKFPHHTFWWEGIDGSRVLAHFLPPDTDCLPEQLLLSELNFKDNDFKDNDSLFGDSLTEQTVDSGTWFQAMEAGVRDSRSWVGELNFECSRGAYTSRAKSKWENRRAEFLLRDAEFLAAIKPGGAEYPKAELDEAWKMLLNQIHDIIPGSSVCPVREESLEQHARVREIGEGAVAKSLDAFTALLDTGDLTHPMAVWNTLSFPRSGVVSVPWKGKSDVNAFAPRGQASRTQVTEEGGERRLLVEVVDVPPMGYIVYELRERARVKESALALTGVARADGRMLENELVRVELNERGEIVSYFDKGHERQVIAPGNAGNRFQLFADADAWDLDPFYDEVCEELTAPAAIEPVENGPLRASVRVERELTLRARLVQYIRLEANSRRLDFETYLDWHEPHALLKVAFPVTVHSPRATCDIQFGHLDHPTHRNASWDIARFEVCAHKWADLSEGDYGVALLNDGKYGYDVQRNVLRLSLLSSPKCPDDGADMGRHRFTYSLLPHRGEVESSGVPLAGYDLNVPFYARLLPVQHGMLARAHSYFRVDKPNLVIEAVKRAEDGDGLIVRLFEAYRRRGAARLLVNGLCSRATRTDLLERNLDDLPVQGGAVAFEYKPFEIITLRLR